MAHKFTLVVPMAGEGSRFKAEYNLPKPLIPVDGEPMFVRSIKCTGVHELPELKEIVFLVRREHVDEYAIGDVVREHFWNARVVVVDELTEGAACTVMLAEEYINNTNGMAVLNCDQIMGLDIHDWWQSTQDGGTDGSVWTFECPDQDPKWSYSKTREDDATWIERVAEKDPISTHATAGFYYWRNGCDFVRAVQDMIAADDRTNNEFYLCPTINYNIRRGQIFRNYNIDSMHGTGTPEDLREYEKNSAQR